ncbi:MAG: hypothetical protein M3298_05360 [Thermoproteota archaeon]|nr:hypothetical protein [Thermoproteota archaeon]MDQ3807578.1 hypothetical protein [Thermoproteota archaeon]
MKHLNNNKKNNTIVAAAKVLSLATTTLVLAIGVTTMAPLTALGAISGGGEEGFTEPSTLHRSARAPVVVSGDNIYIAWWTNNTANNNEEVMFRASNDGGATFGDKINLSNTTDADSWRVEIAGEGDSVVVSWWETNQTSDVPVARISTDGGETFGAMLMLGMNGTISDTEEGGGAAAGGGETTTEEEAVGGAEVAE